MNLKFLIATAITMAISGASASPFAALVADRHCLPNGSARCDLSGHFNCCSGFCAKLASQPKGICRPMGH